MRPSQVQNAVYNGRAYRIIFERANFQHPEGSKIGVFTGDPAYKLEVWIHIALPFETDEELGRQAHEKAKADAATRTPG
jgi:hypothetical protein